MTERIIRLAIEVHKTLGPGFVESIYENALMYEMKKNGLNFESQKTVIVRYKDVTVGEHRVDLVVEDKVILELKAVKDFEEIHLAQIISYLIFPCSSVFSVAKLNKTYIKKEEIHESTKT